MKHSVIVGNIGEVYSGNNYVDAGIAFSEYQRQSKDNYGRAAGESVTWFQDGEIHDEYLGTLGEEDSDV